MSKTALHIFFLLSLYFHPKFSCAQHKEPTRLFRVYEDNDILNVTGKGTDRAYTNGLRLELFYKKKKQSLSPVDDWMPKAGNNSNDTFGWALMQQMLTPGDLANPNFQADDYPYSGVLFLTHSLVSYNKNKKYNFQTEILAGIRGRASFAGQSQILIHRLINDRLPKGWRNQLKTRVLLNLNFATEKRLASLGTLAEIIGGASLSAGTLNNALTVYPLIRLGRMTPYFDGFFSQYIASHAGGRKFQLYFFTKPKLTVVASNALLHGQIERSSGADWMNHSASTAQVNRFIAEIEYGLVMVMGKISFSYTQKPTTAYTRGMYNHNVGNISILVAW